MGENMSLVQSIELFKKLPVEDDYAEELQEIDFFNLSYEAKGIDYTLGEAPDGEIIHRFDCEEKNDYNQRRKQTPTRSYVSTILNKYTSAVFRNEPIRFLDSDTLNLLYKDSDLLGTPLNVLMKKACKIAQIEGCSFLLADSTVAEGEIKTVAQAQQSGQRSFIRVLKRESVLNYIEADDVLLEALVMFNDENGERFVRYMDREVFIDIMIDDKMVVQSVSEPYLHGYSNIPLVELEPFDYPQSEPIAYSQRAIVNTLSLLKQEEVDQTFTRFVISGVRLEDNDQNKKLTWGSKRLVTMESTATVSRIGADKSQADSLRESIKEEENSLYYQAGFGRSNVADQATNISGTALLIQREDFFNNCNLIKLAVEGAENAILSLIAGKEGFDFTPSVYSDKFVQDDNGDALNRLRDLLALPGMPATIRRLAILNYVNTFYNVSDADMEAMVKELEALQ